MVKKEKGEGVPSSADPGGPQGHQPLDSLEQVLANFVQTFESSAQRWEKAVYPFIKSFEASAKRWERMVYPAIIVFGMMGLSGFWLIYSLTMDVHELARNVDPKMERNLAEMSMHISSLAGSVETMTLDIAEMSSHIAHLDASILVMQGDMSMISTKLDTLPPLLLNIAEMNQSIKSMTVSTGVMSHDMGRMNQSIGRPMSFMNSFAPW